jgi:hypothetical protein
MRFLLLTTVLLLLESINCTSRFRSWQDFRRVSDDEGCKYSMILDAFINIAEGDFRNEVDLADAVQTYITEGYPLEFVVVHRLNVPEPILEAQMKYLDQYYMEFIVGRYRMKATLCHDAQNWLRRQVLLKTHVPSHEIPVTTNVVSTPETIEYRLMIDGPFEKVYRFSLLAEVLLKGAKLELIRSVLEAGAEISYPVTIFDAQEQIFRNTNMMKLAEAVHPMSWGLLSGFTAFSRPLLARSSNSLSKVSIGPEEESEMMRDRAHGKAYTMDQPVVMKPRPKKTSTKSQCCCIS